MKKEYGVIGKLIVIFVSVMVISQFILVSVATIQFIKLYYQFDSSTPAHTNISKTEE